MERDGPDGDKKVLEPHETALKMVDSDFASSEPQSSRSTPPSRTRHLFVDRPAEDRHAEGPRKRTTHRARCQTRSCPSVVEARAYTVLPLHEVPFQCSAASASTPMHDVAEPQLSATNATWIPVDLVGAVHVTPLNVAASVRFASAQNVADAQDTYDASSAVKPDQLVPLKMPHVPRRRWLQRRLPTRKNLSVQRHDPNGSESLAPRAAAEVEIVPFQFNATHTAPTTKPTGTHLTRRGL